MKKIIFIVIGFLIGPVLAFAAGEYTPLVNIPGVTNKEVTNTPIGPYISNTYKWVISMSIILAVVMFTVHAFRYLLSEANVSNKSAAKSGMQDVIIGLLLVLGAWLILNTINPALVNFNLCSFNGSGNPCNGSANTTTK